MQIIQVLSHYPPGVLSLTSLPSFLFSFFLFSLEKREENQLSARFLFAFCASLIHISTTHLFCEVLQVIF